MAIVLLLNKVFPYLSLDFFIQQHEFIFKKEKKEYQIYLKSKQFYKTRFETSATSNGSLNNLDLFSWWKHLQKLEK